MIRVSVFYPNGADARFDFDYYAGKHVELVHDRLDALGLVEFQVDKGVGGDEPGAPAPFIAIGRLTFRTLEDFQGGFAEHGEDIMADLPNFTNLQPQIQVSQVVK